MSTFSYEIPPNFLIEEKALGYVVTVELAPSPTVTNYDYFDQTITVVNELNSDVILTTSITTSISVE
jgi:hypothetical protein